MIRKKDLIIAVLATFCLTATLFMIAPTSSVPTRRYDPWLDYNDDGKIELKDVYAMDLAYGATGTPINKTQLLLQVNATYTSLISRMNALNATIQLLLQMNVTYTSLLSRIDALNASMLQSDASLLSQIISLETQIVTLNASIIQLQQRTDDLETQLAVINATKLGKPDWNTTGWYGPLAFGDTVFNHNLHLNFTTTDVLVYMIGRQTLTGSILQKDYGGWQQANGNWYGAYWYGLTANTITVHRHGNDGDWVYVRILIWKIPK
jgi:hypothetical protein